MQSSVVLRPPLAIARPRRVIGVDLETCLIPAGDLAPPMVVMSTAERNPESSSGFDAQLFLPQDAVRWLHWALDQPDILLVIHNGPFDGGVSCFEDPTLIPKFFDAVNQGRVCNTITKQKVIDVAFGMRKFRRYRGKVVKTTYTLGDLIEMYYEEHVQKDDTWRLSYALLRGIPLEKWPKNAKLYAAYDAVLHLRLWEAQEELIRVAFDGNLPNQIEQQRAAWVLHLMSMWGLRAEKKYVDKFVQHCEEEIAKMHAALYHCLNCSKPQVDHLRVGVEICTCGDFKNTAIFKWNRQKRKPSRSMEEIRRRVTESFIKAGLEVPMTDPSPKFPKGQVSTDKDTLLLTNDPHLHVLAESMTYDKHLGQWGPVLNAAVLRPVCCRYDELVETGRTASSGSEGQEGTNCQNPPRKGDVRPAIVPRPGWLFCSTDADTIELRAQAQNCLEMVSWSKMAQAIIDQFYNGGPDLHERLGANLVGTTAEELRRLRKLGDIAMIDARQFAKIPGFGLWGGLGPETLIAFAAAQLSREQFLKWFGSTHEQQLAKAKWIVAVWKETWPEAVIYFKKVGEMIDRKVGHGTIRQLMSGRIRGGVTFTAAANGFFQGRVADAMKEILWRLADECYTGRETTKDGLYTGRISVLYGSRLAMFLHDEPILEHPIKSAAERAERQRVIVVETLSKWMPDVPCSSSAVLMHRWQKGAEPGYLCRCGKFYGKPKCDCGSTPLLAPVKPLKTDGKILWVYDDGAEEHLTLKVA
jgi:DNA polymerase I-like protein with 3'-5' exonuclease and polymerase domains